MSDPTHRVENPAEAFEKLRTAMRQVLTVSKPEIVRREAEAKVRREQKRKNGLPDSS